MKLSPKSRALERAKNSLASYAALMYPRFENPPHIRAIIEKLEAVERGEIDRLMIFMPPRHGKSLITSQLFPAWFIGRNSTKSIIASSYGAELASDFGRATRNFVASPTHRAVFPQSIMSDDLGSIHRFAMLGGGAYFAVGSGGALTGRGADLLLLDDLLKGYEQANSETERASLKSWFENVAYTRLQPGGAIVFISTRWHLDDLPGSLLREHASENWQVLSLPALAEPDDPLGRAEGAALWPSQYPIKDLERIREAVGSSAWLSLYQCRPSAAEGSTFKRNWWRYAAALPEKFEQIVLSVDSAYKVGRQNDYSVILTLGVSQNAYHVIDVVRERLEFPALLKKVELLAERFRPHCLLVEDSASGQSLIQVLRANTRLAVKPIKPDSDKISRANAVVPLVEAGRVVLPAGAGWLGDFIDELSSFPKAPHDDQVDALSMALRYVADFGGDVGFRGLKKLDAAKAAVASGVPIDDAAKAAGVAPSRLEGWIDRTSAGGQASRLAAMSARPAAVGTPAPVKPGAKWNPWCGVLEPKK